MNYTRRHGFFATIADAIKGTFREKEIVAGGMDNGIVAEKSRIRVRYNYREYPDAERADLARAWKQYYGTLPDIMLHGIAQAP